MVDKKPPQIGWEIKPDGSVDLWPVVDFDVRAFPNTIGAALWVVLSPEHAEGVKAGDLVPSRIQAGMTADRAREIGRLLIAAADEFERHPEKTN